jgi:succinate dehydrogenase / fumarate reductase membrane anchor subunit
MSGKKYDPLVSNLAAVKGLGAAGSGTGVWLAQRFTALALIPLSVWFVVTLVKLFIQDNQVEIMSCRMNVVLLMLFIYFGLHHSMIGMKEIIEDYIHCTKLKFTLIIFLKLFTILTGVMAIVAVIFFNFVK